MRRGTGIVRGIGAIMMIAVLATMLPLAATAQTPTPETDRRTIKVEGTGTVEVAPDTADITFGVVTQNESLETAQDENSTRAQAIIDTFEAAGIAEQDIATAGYSVSPVPEYDRDGNYVGIKSFEVWNQVTVTIRDLSIVGTVLDDAVGAGANTVSAISFYVDNTDEAASQARTAAIDNARVKADEMAEAAGVIVVGVYSIEETSAPEPAPMMYATGGASERAADSQASEVPVSPGQTSVTVRVKAVFEIDQPQG